MSIISEVIHKINSGMSLELAIPEGADPRYWAKIVANYNPAAKPKTKRNRPDSGNRKSRGYFKQVAVCNLATAQLVSRVNRNEIPFDGRPGDDCDESSEESRLGLPVEW